MRVLTLLRAGSLSLAAFTPGTEDLKHVILLLQCERSLCCVCLYEGDVPGVRRFGPLHGEKTYFLFIM